MTVAAMESRASLVAAFARDNMARPFEWGRWDCNLFCLAWLDVLLGPGHDYYAIYAGQYRSEGSARDWCRESLNNLLSVLEYGGCTVVEAGRNYAQHGDFLLVDDPTEPWYRGHVCAGAHFMSVWPGCPGGFRMYPMARMPIQAHVLRLPCPR